MGRRHPRLVAHPRAVAAVSHAIDLDGLPYARDRQPKKPDVGADAFFVLDLRVGRVLAVEPLPEARKPLPPDPTAEPGAPVA